MDTVFSAFCSKPNGNKLTAYNPENLSVSLWMFHQADHPLWLTFGSPQT